MNTQKTNNQITTELGGDWKNSFSKNCQLNGSWKTVYLTESDLEVVYRQHRKHVKKVMKECLEVAAELGLTRQMQVVAAVGMFERSCHSVYSFVANALDYKVRLERKKSFLQAVNEDSNAEAEKEGGKSSSNKRCKQAPKKCVICGGVV